MTVTAYVHKKSDTTFVANIVVEKNGILGDGQITISPGQSLFEKIPFEELKEGIYDKSGKFLGTDPFALEA